MSAPGDEELENAATTALLPNVSKVKNFFDLARAMEQVRSATTAKTGIGILCAAQEVGGGRHKIHLLMSLALLPCAADDAGSAEETSGAYLYRGAAAVGV